MEKYTVLPLGRCLRGCTKDVGVALRNESWAFFSKFSHVLYVGETNSTAADEGSSFLTVREDHYDDTRSDGSRERINTPKYCSKIKR